MAMENFDFNKFYTKNRQQYYIYLYRIIRNESDCEEVLNDCFMKFKGYIDNGTYNEDLSGLNTYFYIIMKCQIIDYLRKNSIRNAILFDVEDINNINEYEKSVENVAIEKIANNEQKQLLEMGLSKLKPKMREVIELFYYSDLSYFEISKIMDISISNVKVLLFRAKECLETELKSVIKQY